MSIQSQKKNMKTIHGLVSQNLGYIYGGREAGPNGAKRQFHTKSAAFLRALAMDLGLNPFKVANNHAGIAGSGDITLMGMWNDGSGLYLQIAQPVANRQAFLYRSIAHMKDYSGGVNQWLPLDLFANGAYEKLLDTLLRLRKNTKEVAGRVA